MVNQWSNVMTAKVVSIGGQRGLQLSLDQLVGFEGVKVLAKLIQKEVVRGVLLKTIAQRANLTTRTVSKIMNRETMSPRMLTCIMIFKALGFTAVKFE
jgi:hypothetical protein